MKIMSWNMGLRSARSQKIQEIWEYLEKQNPDIAFLQEAKVPKHIYRTHTIMEDSTYRKAKSCILTKNQKAKIFSLEELNEDLSDAIASFVGQNVAVSFELQDSGEIFFISVHTSSKAIDHEFQTREVRKATGSPRWQGDKVWPSDVLFSAFKQLPDSGKKFIIGGDINQSRLMDSTMNYGESVSAWFKNREKEGIIDCFRLFHEEEQRTWFRYQKRYKKWDAPYQLDHFFCDIETSDKITKCWVDREAAERGLSDHAPIFMEMNEQLLSAN